jgi:hypothetical protein
MAIAAIAASTAQAEEGALPTTTFTGKSGGGTLETLKEEKITCSATNILEGVMTSDSQGKVASVHVTGCKATTAFGNFALNSLGDEKEVVLATNLLGSICLNAGIFYLFFEYPAVHIEVPTIGDLWILSGSRIAEIVAKAGEKRKTVEIKFKQMRGDPEPKECTGADGKLKTAKMTVELGTTKTDDALLGSGTAEGASEIELMAK